MTVSTVIGKTLNLYTPNRTTYGSSGGTATAIGIKSILQFQLHNLLILFL